MVVEVGEVGVPLENEEEAHYEVVFGEEALHLVAEEQAHCKVVNV